jgi:hypothetical protein
MNNSRSGPGGAFISGSNVIIAAGGFDNSSFFDTASAEVLTPCIPTPTPTPPACPTPTPHPPCGLLIGDGLTIGFEPNGYQLIASNIVNYTFSSSISAPNDYAIFETHDPWGFTVLKDAITAAGHTCTVFTPAELVGFDFSQYRVVILNWDDTFGVTSFARTARPFLRWKHTLLQEVWCGCKAPSQMAVIRCRLAASRVSTLEWRIPSLIFAVR